METAPQNGDEMRNQVGNSTRENSNWWTKPSRPARDRKDKESEPNSPATQKSARVKRGSLHKVTEACKGFLRLDGNQPSSVKGRGSLIARPTRRAGTKVGLSDPTVPSGRAVEPAQS